MAQNIPMGLLQTAQQQYGNQGTTASTQADTDGSSSMKTLEGMMARGGAAQKLAQQRNLENQKGLQRLFAEAGVGPQGLLNTLGISLGNALGQRSADKNPDGAMQNAKEVDSSLEKLDVNDPNRALVLADYAMYDGRPEDAARYFRLHEIQKAEVTNKNIASEVSSFSQMVQDVSNKDEANKLLLIAASNPHLRDFIVPLEKAISANFPATEKGNREKLGIVQLPDGRNVMAFTSDTEGVGYIGLDGTYNRIDPTLVKVKPSGTTSSNPKQYDFEDGTTRDTFFDKQRQMQMYFDDNGNLQQVPVSAKESMNKTQASFAELKAVSQDLIQTKNQIKSLSTYLEKRGGARQGFLALADSLTAKVKTLIGTDLNEEEFNLAVAEGRFQGLIGQVRVETVGGGVMTEQDALRIIYRLGGIGAFSNKEVVADAIRDILTMKAETYYSNAAMSNMARNSNASYAKYVPAEDTESFEKQYLSFIFPKQEEQPTLRTKQEEQPTFRKIVNTDGKIYYVNDTTKGVMTEEEYLQKQNGSGN